MRSAFGFKAILINRFMIDFHALPNIHALSDVPTLGWDSL